MYAHLSVVPAGYLGVGVPADVGSCGPCGESYDDVNGGRHVVAIFEGGYAGIK